MNLFVKLKRGKFKPVHAWQRWFMNNNDSANAGEQPLDTRPWGSMVLYAHEKSFWLKRIDVKPGGRLSLQKHEKRGELWMCIEGSVTATIDGTEKELTPFEHVAFGVNTPHRLSSEEGGSIIEIGFGECDEEDNTRLEDDYGRA